VRPARFLLILACASLCGAQPTAASPPKILLLVRQQFKPGTGLHRERLERAMSRACNSLDVPIYWMEMQAFTGAPEALFFGPYDSFEGVEKAGAVLGSLYQAHPDLAQIQAGIDETLASQRTILAERRDSPGVSSINLAQARFLRMVVVQMKPGQDAPINDTPIDDAPIVENAVVYRVTSGMPGPTFLLFQPMAAFSQIPAVHVTAGTIVEDTVYAIEPQLSHISREFAAQGREFWTKLP
jgi:hypothetical protein